MSGDPFTKKESVDTPGIVGAQWWQESIAVPRRQALGGIVVLGAAMAMIATVGTCAAVRASSSPSSDDVSFQSKNALDMQKEYGWDFGAVSEALVFDGQTQQAFERASLARLPTDLAPADPRLTPFFVPTLFQSLMAAPKTTLTGDARATPFVPVIDALRPIYTTSMDTAFKQGQSLASLFAGDPRAREVAVIVDLPGPEAVAFAAGASNALDPVFLFDNWPHPRAVVPAHLTLAAAAYYQPMFAAARTAPSSRGAAARLPVFVLDRKRLTPYSDEASQFDNRHTAKLPNAANLARLGVKHVLYVVPSAADHELDDLVDDFLAYAGAKLGLHMLAADAFYGPGGSTERVYYTGSEQGHTGFWTDFNRPRSNVASIAGTFTPTARKTDFSAGIPATDAPRPRPATFGFVPVAIALGTGVILGSRYSRSGSWNRTSWTSSGS